MQDDREPITKTKITLPRRRAELLSRARLLEVLYDRLDRKLIIISAAAGYGKTSLLLDLAYHSDWPFCWLALDALDRQPQRFIACLIASLAERFPGFGKRSRSLLTGMTSLEESVERLLVSLVNEIHEDIEEHFVLVLDDFHVLDEVTPVVAFVNRFIQLVGENCHIVIASRTLPELRDLSLLVAREDVGGLDYSDLAFTAAEIQALLAQNRQIHLSDEQAQQLVDITEGWITGLQFTDLAQLASAQEAFRTPARLGVTVFDYWGQQVLQQQTTELQKFMMRTSLLDEFDARLCEAVLGPLYPQAPDWPRLIETLSQRNLFTLPVGTNGQWLRYHHLFRDYLQQRFRAECPEEVMPILRRLAAAQEAEGQWERAYDTCSQLHDPEALAGLVERSGIPMYQHAMLTLDAWLKALPPSAIRQRPGLLSLLGNVEAIKGNLQDGHRLLTQAVERYGEHNDRAGLALALARRGSAERRAGNYENAMRDLEQAAALTESEDDLQWIYADALRGTGLCLFRRGQTLQAIQLLDRALSIYTRIHDAPSIPLLLMETALVHGAKGDYSRARASYERALEIWRASGDLLRQGILLNNLGVLHQQVGEYERALECFEEGLLCAQRSGDSHDEVLILLGLGDLFTEVSDWEMAELNYRRGGVLARQLGEAFISHYHILAQAGLELSKGDPAPARRTLDRAGAVIKADESAYEYGLYQLLRGRLALQENDPPRAAMHLSEAKRCFHADGREMESVWSCVWLGAARAQNRDRDGARQELLESLGASGSVGQSAAVAAMQARQWLDVLRNNGGTDPAIRRLLEKSDRLGDRLPSVRRQLRRLARTVEPAGPTLRIRAFGSGQVWLNGQLIGMTDWQTQSVRELFFFLLYSRRPLSREQIGTALWPSTEEPARFRMRFKNEIYRLRRAVGQETILFDGEMYYFNAAIDHKYDVEDFEAYVSRAGAAAKATEAIEFYERATALVQGKYLQDMGSSWVLPEQERLHQAHLSAMHALANLYVREGRLPKALEVCQKSVADDPTYEAAYRLMMEIYRRLGDRGSIVHVYKLCEAAIQSTYGLPPSRDTQELYRQLTS